MNLMVWMVVLGVLFGLLTNLTNWFKLGTVWMNVMLGSLITGYYGLAEVATFIPQLPLWVYTFWLAYFVATFGSMILRRFIPFFP